MESRAVTDRELHDDPAARLPAWLLGLIPLALIIAAVGTFAALGGPGLGDRRGPPAEELAVEKTVLAPGTIELTVRNDGPDAVAIAQVQVNDAFVQFSGADQPIGRLDSATVRVQQPWVEGEAYEVALLTSSGGTIAHEIAAAVETPATDLSFFGLMALLGIYVGVIPVALGMLWLPWIRRIPPSWLRGVMALTVGLLVFLAIDATLEGIELAGEGSQAFGGAALVFVGAVVAFLLLTGVSAWLEQRRSAARAAGASGGHLALLVAVGIGLHNLGEGVAIGSGLLGRRARAGGVPRRRLRAAQHDRGPRDRRPDRPSAPIPAAARAARPDRRGAGRARRVDRRRGVQREPGRVPVRLRRRRDRPGDRAAHPVAARRRGPRAAPGRGDRPAGRHRAHVRHGPARQRVSGSAVRISAS